MYIVLFFFGCDDLFQFFFLCQLERFISVLCVVFYIWIFEIKLIVNDSK